MRNTFLSVLIFYNSISFGFAQSLSIPEVVIYGEDVSKISGIVSEGKEMFLKEKWMYLPREQILKENLFSQAKGKNFFLQINPGVGNFSSRLFEILSSFFNYFYIIS